MLLFKNEKKPLIFLHFGFIQQETKRNKILLCYYMIEEKKRKRGEGGG